MSLLILVLFIEIVLLLINHHTNCLGHLFSRLQEFNKRQALHNKFSFSKFANLFVSYNIPSLCEYPDAVLAFVVRLSDCLCKSLSLCVCICVCVCVCVPTVCLWSTTSSRSQGRCCNLRRHVALHGELRWMALQGGAGLIPPWQES